MDFGHHDNDFEHFLKKNADQYRMFPSDNVWDGIHSTLHGRRKWYGIGLALLLISTLSVTWVMVLQPAHMDNTQLANVVPTEKTQAAQARKANAAGNEQAQAVAILVNPERVADKGTTQNKPARNHFFVSANNSPEFNSYDRDLTTITPVEEVVEHAQTIEQAEEKPVEITRSSYKKSSPLLAERNDNVVNLEILDKFKPTLDAEHMLRPDPVAVVENEKVLETRLTEKAPYTIESVLNLYKYIAPRKRVYYQLYVVPTVSYRKLVENKPFLQQARTSNGVSSFPTQSDINQAVTHKPDIGFELGVNAGYPILKNLRLTAGLQFNVSKYDIKAFFYQGEVATIALNSGAGLNSVSTVTNYRNYGSGSIGNWLRNLYVSGSIPIGAEYRFVNTKTSYVGFGATVQPTYVLDNQSYLISTDLKNYAEVPSLIRRWNMNTSFEVFAGNLTGKVKWRVGPQVRYQVYSSFEDKYPVKEHLFDYGIKVGIMLK